MSQFDEVFSSSEWAFALAEALERQLGDRLTVHDYGSGTLILSLS
jgi:hypothetical protein